MPRPELPPESTLKYVRALGLANLFELLGWEVRYEIHVHVPREHWTPKQIRDICLKYDVPVQWESENHYIGPNGTWGTPRSGWKRGYGTGAYPLLLGRGWDA